VQRQADADGYGQIIRCFLQRRVGASALDDARVRLERVRPAGEPAQRR